MSYRREVINNLNYKKKSKFFLLPMLESPLYHQNTDCNYLIDVLIVQSGFPQIVLVFDNVDYEPLSMDIYRLQNHHCYIDAVYDDDNKEICLFFDVPKEFREDYELFINGKYSRFSHPFKVLLTKKYGNQRLDGYNEKTGLPLVGVYDAIYPNQDKKKALAKSLQCDVDDIGDEVFDQPIIEYEEYKTIEELRELYGIKQ